MFEKIALDPRISNALIGAGVGAAGVGGLTHLLGGDWRYGAAGGGLGGAGLGYGYGEELKDLGSKYINKGRRFLDPAYAQQQDHISSNNERTAEIDDIMGTLFEHPGDVQQTGDWLTEQATARKPLIDRLRELIPYMSEEQAELLSNSLTSRARGDINELTGLRDSFDEYRTRPRD